MEIPRTPSPAEAAKKIHERNKHGFPSEIAKGDNGPKGLGDTLAKLTKKVGIKPCGGCRERQKKLNEMFPYKEK